MVLLETTVLAGSRILNSEASAASFKIVAEFLFLSNLLLQTFPLRLKTIQIQLRFVEGVLLLINRDVQGTICHSRALNLFDFTESVEA